MQPSEVMEQLLLLFAQAEAKGGVRIKAAFHAVIHEHENGNISCAASGEDLTIADLSNLTILLMRRTIGALRLVGRDEDEIRLWLQASEALAFAEDENESGWTLAKEKPDAEGNPQKNDDGDQFQDPGRRW